MIQMYHAVMQTLDLHLEVYYPLPYLAQAIPIALPQREQMLVVAREILLSNERYTAYVEASLIMLLNVSRAFVILADNIFRGKSVTDSISIANCSLPSKLDLSILYIYVSM